MLEHGARDELPDPLALQSEPPDQSVQCRSQHVLIGRGGVRAVGAREGDTTAADHSDFERHHLDQLLTLE